MSKRKKTPVSPSWKINIYKSTFIIFFCLLLIIIKISYSQKDNKTDVKETYYTGNYDSIATAANMLDMISSEDNILISPFNINTSLAYIYNGTDNKSYNEIKSYFKKDLKKINDEINQKINIISETEEKNEFNILYDKLMTEFLNNDYDKYNLNSISLLNSESKQHLQLLLKKMQLTYNRISGINDLNSKTIAEYTLSEKEIITSDFALKLFLDEILSNIEDYTITNHITNYTGLYITNSQDNMIVKNFLDYTSNYNVNIVENYQLTDINAQLKKLTNDKIKRINTNLTNSSITLINTLYFDYAWETPFKVSHEQNSVFFNNNGLPAPVQMMYSEENLYLENDYVQGFIKPFKDKKYSFVSILPKNKNIKISTINITSLINNVKKQTILVGLPKFEYQSETNLKNIHENLGIKEIYSDKANLTRMSDNLIKIDENIQKNSITIGEKGTKESNVVTDNIEPFIYGEGIEKIIFDKEFFFLIINNETNDVLLIGRVSKL